MGITWQESYQQEFGWLKKYGTNTDPLKNIIHLQIGPAIALFSENA